MQMEKSRVEKREMIDFWEASGAIAKRFFMEELVKNLKANSRTSLKG